MTVEGHVKLRNYVILGLVVWVLFLAFKPESELKEDNRIFVLEKENERLKGLYNEQKQIAIVSIQKTDSIKALKPKLITKYKTIYRAIDSMAPRTAINKMDSIFTANNANDSTERAKFGIKNIARIDELTELDSLNKSIIASQDTTINVQKGIIAIADTLHSNDELIKQELKDSNKKLRKQIIKEKVKTRLVAIAGVTLVVLAIIAL